MKSRSDEFSELPAKERTFITPNAPRQSPMLSKELRLTAASAKSPSALVAPAKPAPAVLVGQNAEGVA